METIYGYDEKAAARILSVTTRTLRAWRKAGKVSFHLTPGGRVRYTLEQLLEVGRVGRVDAAFFRILPHSSAQPQSTGPDETPTIAG